MTRLHTTLAAAVAAAALLAPRATARAQAVGNTVSSQHGRTGTQVGLSGATFLELPVGAREAALSGAAAATSNGLTSLFWNTAASAEVRNVSAALSRSNLYGNSGLQQTYAAVGVPLGGATFAGVSFNHFTSGEIVRTTEQFPNGGDPSGGGTVEWIAYSVGLHGARRLTDRLSVGAAAKYISEGATIAHASWYALDVSTLFRTGLYGITLGASVQNLGGDGRFGGKELERTVPSRAEVFPVTRTVPIELNMESVPLPGIVQFAVNAELLGGPNAIFHAGGRYHTLMLNAAVVDPTDRAIQPLAGVEYTFRQVLSLRAGKRFYTPEDGPWSYGYGMSYGLGLAFPVFQRRFTFDYATFRMSSSDLPMTNTFTLQLGY